MVAGEDKLYGLPEEERQRLNKLAAAAITEAAFKEQVLFLLCCSEAVWFEQSNSSICVIALKSETVHTQKDALLASV